MTIILLHHGDITKLNVECIVNASNPSGLGCQIKNHCIDSAIHFAAGPKLLEECKKLNGIPTGQAKITYGYDLPSKYIIHVTGPKKDKSEDHKMLSTCYINCLNLATKNKITEIAFCCISTGIYGFNKYNAAKTAINTTMTWLKSNVHNINKVIFVTYTKEDKIIYEKLLKFFDCSH